MAKREKSLNRAEKIAVSKAVDDKALPAVAEAVDNVTSMVKRAGRPKIIASYQTLSQHRMPVVARVKAAIAVIQQSYAEHDKDDRDARDARHELSDETLDYVVDCFDQNGFSNSSDRLVFAWLMLDLLKPIGHRTDEILNLIEKTFTLRDQVLSEKGLGAEIKRRRERQQKRREEQKKAA